MSKNERILIFSPEAKADFIDPSTLANEGYEVTNLSNLQEIYAWLNTFREDTLLIITHHSPDEGLAMGRLILEAHPGVPIVLVAPSGALSTLKQALDIGLADYVSVPVEAQALHISIQRGLAKSKMWQKQEHYAQVLAGLQDGFILTDSGGRLLLVNKAAQAIFTIQDGVIEGKRAEDVFEHPDLLDIIASKQSRRLEIALEDGRVFAAQASQISGVGVAVVLQDITHLKELDRIKTDFVNTVSHDLRSPLTAIYGFVGLIDRVGPVNPQQTEFIRHIQSSVQHITALINDLLELGRVEADHDIQMQDVDLREIVKRSVDALDYQVSEKMQELTLRLDDIPTILGNPLHLQRMVINLIDNAAKFTPALGKISVRCKAEANQVMLEVCDNGPGIPLNEQPNIFDKFYRGSNFPENIPGTGLGLSIVQSIVEQHHGRIWLESSPAGTTFTVIFPIK